MGARVTPDMAQYTCDLLTPLRSEARYAPFAEICVAAFLLVEELF